MTTSLKPLVGQSLPIPEMIEAAGAGIGRECSALASTSVRWGNASGSRVATLSHGGTLRIARPDRGQLKVTDAFAHENMLGRFARVEDVFEILDSRFAVIRTDRTNRFTPGNSTCAASTDGDLDATFMTLRDAAAHIRSEYEITQMQTDNLDEVGDLSGMISMIGQDMGADNPGLSGERLTIVDRMVEAGFCQL